jgi:cellulose synthase/poly-beta-1,6-N-acetylglucosamine synthase-like glycosyltransferase
MSTPPAISVAIPLYNQADHVADAVGSIVTQSVADFEVIVINDGSTDDGPQRVQAFIDPRIRVESQANAGVADARNRALREARTELVAFLDADDVWAPDHLRHLLELSSRYPQAALFGNRFVAFDRDLPPAAVNPVEYRMLDDYFAACAYRTPPLFTSSCMVRREAALAAGGFASGHSRGEDLALWINLAATAPVAVSSYTGCYYRRKQKGLTSHPVLAPDISMQTLQHLLATRPDWPAARRQSVAEYYSRIALAHALDCLRAGEPTAAQTFIELAAGTRAFRTRWWLATLLRRAPQFARDLVFRATRALRPSDRTS